MFKKILIANRGEIACRIIKTAKKMGIETVAVYSDADSRALHVHMADEAVNIGPPDSINSYLKIDNIIDACIQTNADAVHPGYGFLSENKNFAVELEKKGITFIGPPPDAIQAMGDKITSKKIAEDAGVSIVPGHVGIINSAAEAIKISDQIGYPVMIKASAGGGGKGMRIAHNKTEVKEGFDRAKSEAKSSFGDDRVFVEKFIEQPRHIEIQILADQHQNYVYVGERECSIQRRHQKVVEEAPSPFITDSTREAMGKEAIALARSVGYFSAGTVEFIVDSRQNFYFLEMNTRLQVEHPVTELVYGVDLVELMIMVADGQVLPIKQNDIKINGWALECRVYAEDPYRNFLPSTGRLIEYIPPANGPNVRVDSGVREGGEISMYYDPMVSKLCTWGENREHAIVAMREALDKYYISGIRHNLAFLSSIMHKKQFVDGNITTDFIAQNYPDGFSELDLMSEEIELFIALAAFWHHSNSSRMTAFGRQNPKDNHLSSWIVKTQKGQHSVSVQSNIQNGIAKGEVTVDGSSFDIILLLNFGNPLCEVQIDNRLLHLQVLNTGNMYEIFHNGAFARVEVYSSAEYSLLGLMRVKEPPDLSKLLMSPMPGLLVSLEVKEGEEFKDGQTLAIVEAMKMENVLKAERDGVVKKLNESSGSVLALDQVIMEFE